MKDHVHAAKKWLFSPTLMPYGTALTAVNEMLPLTIATRLSLEGVSDIDRNLAVIKFPEHSLK
ncbi:hypothetical protein [Duncaniella dubosii]|uniref:hypothetical protein n=1 Tax=Duncaniella dubosii TaxID=2518971 RepID=UPI003F67B098